MLVFLDETHIDTRTTYRMNGWGKRGERVQVSHNWVRGKRCDTREPIRSELTHPGGLSFRPSRSAACCIPRHARALLTAMRSLPMSNHSCAS